MLDWAVGRGLQASRYASKLSQTGKLVCGSGRGMRRGRHVKSICGRGRSIINGLMEALRRYLFSGGLHLKLELQQQTELKKLSDHDPSKPIYHRSSSSILNTIR